MGGSTSSSKSSSLNLSSQSVVLEIRGTGTGQDVGRVQGLTGSLVAAGAKPRVRLAGSEGCDGLGTRRATCGVVGFGNGGA
jgi:hypothetical protein